MSGNAWHRRHLLHVLAGAAATAPFAAGTRDARADEPRLGAALIGKYEGPELVLDPAELPKHFQEAPELAQRVKAGKLPPVAERIGQDPLALRPTHEIGRYGGTLRGAFMGPSDFLLGVRTASGGTTLLYYDCSGYRVVPNIARGYEQAPDGRSLTLFLRRGMRWSSGAPFDADDFMFWCEDIFSNTDLTPVRTALMTINGKPITLEKVDRTTVVFRMPEPHYLFADILAGTNVLSNFAWYGYAGGGCFAPSAYLKQFHPKYADAAELDRKVRASTFNSWATLFQNRNTWFLNPELPSVSPWLLVTAPTDPVWQFERNPYSIWTDSAGNQLPYIDRIENSLVQNLDALSVKAIAGEIDYQSRNILLSKLPVLLRNQESGGYKVHLDPGEYGADMAIYFNLSYDGDAEIARLFNIVEFRRALSLGFDRDQINDTFWLGTGTPSSVVPADTNPYTPGPEYRTLWSTHDPAQANALLDKIGLTRKDRDGFRLRGDGKGRLTIELMTVANQFMPFTEIGEMIRLHMKDIGIDLAVKEVERSLALTRTAANLQQLGAWTNEGTEHPSVLANHLFPFNESDLAVGGPLFARWFNTSGAQGREPPPRLRQVMENWRRSFGVAEPERVRLMKELWRIAAEDVFMIGVVGLGPASTGVRVVRNNVGNAPAREFNSPAVLSPSISRPVQFYLKS